MNNWRYNLFWKLIKIVELSIPNSENNQNCKFTWKQSKTTRIKALTLLPLIHWTHWSGHQPWARWKASGQLVFFLPCRDLFYSCRYFFSNSLANQPAGKQQIHFFPQSPFIFPGFNIKHFSSFCCGCSFAFVDYLLLTLEIHTKMIISSVQTTDQLRKKFASESEEREWL